MIRIAIALALGLLVSSPALCVELDTFEDGSASGWDVVGHGPLMSQYAKSLASPGYRSAYALRLNRKVREGWCGVGISALQKLRLSSCEAVRVAARNAGDVTRILIDAHCSDGTRWWCKVPLPPDGSWLAIEAQAAQFFMVENKQGLESPKLDLTKITTLWLTMDDFAEGSTGPWAMEVDDVELVGEATAGSDLAIPQTPGETPAWTGPAPRVAVLDSTAFLPVEIPDGLPSQIVRVLADAGCDAQLVEPERLAATLDGPGVNVLVLPGPHYPSGAVRRVLAHLEAGRSLWCVGTAQPLSEPVMQAEDGAWRATDGSADSPELLRILDGHVQGRHWLGLTPPELQLTDRGKELWPCLPDRLPATKCGFLAADDSIHAPCAPPWVEVTPLLQVRYESRNWIGHTDRFTGWVAVLLSHRAGPFAGAKVLFTGLPNDDRSILCPGGPAFGAIVVRCVQELAKPVEGRWTETPSSPALGLPEITREGFFAYPGPVFAAMNFGGFNAADATFWEDLDLGGFNCIHVGVPFLDEADGAGDVIDWARADGYVEAARAHEKNIIFDPYAFNTWRWRWAGEQTCANPEFLGKYAAAMGKLAARYSQSPTVLALFLAPSSVGYGAFHVDETQAGVAAWREYVRDSLNLTPGQAGERYGVPVANWEELPLPRHAEGDKYNLGPLWADYLHYFVETHLRFMRTVIGSVRSAAPDMPLLMRGAYLDVGIHMALAAEFEHVAPHCECPETTVDTEAYLRGPALTWGVPITTENGWPKSRGGPQRMALADYLLGGYSMYMYAFGGPRQARPSALDLHDAQRLALKLRRARYGETGLALLIPDTTLYASTPASFSALESFPHIEYAMERSGFRFRAISAQFPNWDGVSIVVDDGQNRVLTEDFRRQAAEWVRRGGTLILFPHTGEFDLAGGDATLADALGVSFALLEGEGSRTVPVGEGRVVVLSPDLLAGQFAVEPDLWESFEGLLEHYGAVRDVVVRPRVNVACFHSPDKAYIVLCNKSPRYVGSYFGESALASVEAGLPDLDLTVEPRFPFQRARNALTWEPLPVERGTVRVHLPRTRYVVVELDK